MTYWWFLVSFAAALAAIAFLVTGRRTSDGGPDALPRSAPATGRWLAPGVALGGVAVVAFLVGLATVRTFMGPESWYDRSPGRELLLFAAMSLGILAHVLSAAIEDRRERRRKNPSLRHPVRIDPWEMLYPFLAATICFGAILEATRANEMGIMVLIFAFQNGFFWQAVVGSAARQAAPRGGSAT